MEQQIQLLAQLAAVDSQLDELHDELGDLPQEVKKLEALVKERLTDVETTQQSITDLDHLRGTAHVTMQESQDKEQRLAKQQFQVKNNREFDAITKEIEHLKHERATLEERLRTAGVREENLRQTLTQQETLLAEAQSKLTDKEQELAHLSGDHNDEMRQYIDVRLKLITKLDDTLELEYERIRQFHSNAAVAIRRNSCSGCYSAIPSQRIMEMKYQRDKMYTCENCGRILFTDDVEAEIDAVMEEYK
jgi:predicted  nucleic acid-binding Zn-ribbon protein